MLSQSYIILANSVDLDEVAHHEPSHLNYAALYFCNAVMRLTDADGIASNVGCDKTARSCLM